MLAVNNSLPVRHRAGADRRIAQAQPRPAGDGLRRQRHHRAPRRRTLQGDDRRPTSCTCPTAAAPQAINDLIGGRGAGSMFANNVPSIGPHVKAGRVRGLGGLGPAALAGVPGDPCRGRSAEIVPGYETVAWGGVMGPANLPRDVVAQAARGGHARRSLRRRVQERYAQARHRDRRRLAGGVPRAGSAARRAEMGGGREAFRREGGLTCPGASTS